MKKLLLTAACIAVLAALPAQAATIFSDDFNDDGFKGTYDVQSISDRFGTTDYYMTANYNGWTFGGNSTRYAVSTATGDGAIMLNEPSGVASRLISGLTVGETYVLSLLLSGDNQPGLPYQFNATMDGNTILTAYGVDGGSGTNPGTLLTVDFVATAESMILGLNQFGSTTTASPVIDNVSIASVPEPLGWAMMVGGFGLLGTALRRDRKVAVSFG